MVKHERSDENPMHHYEIAARGDGSGGRSARVRRRIFYWFEYQDQKESEHK